MSGRSQTECTAPAAHSYTPTRRQTIFGTASLLALASCGDADGNYIQLFDPKTHRIVQLLGTQTSAPADPSGTYLPNSKSPSFERLSPDGALKQATILLGAELDMMVNAAFFESYQPSTQLAFPLKVGGVLVSGGASPYGPRSDPKDPHYATVKLYALAWNRQKAAIVPFDHTDPQASALANYDDAVVSYLWSDHPAVVLAGDPVNRYQLVGVTANGAMMFGTFPKSTLANAAKSMAKNGAVGPSLTMDGGISTCLWFQSIGFVEAPTKPDDAAIGLPHYIAVRAVK